MKKLSDVKLNDFFSNTNSKTKALIKLLLEVSKLANDNGKTVLCQSGLTVPLALGKLYRDHDDLDLFVIEKDLKLFKEQYIKKGYEIGSHGHPDYTFYARKNGLNIDFDAIRIKGDKVSDFDGESEFVYPIKGSEFIWARKIDGVIVKFANPKLVYDFKLRSIVKGKKPMRKKDKQDFEKIESIMPEMKNYKILGKTRRSIE